MNTNQPRTCECCGHPLVGEGEVEGLSPVERAIFNFARGRGQKGFFWRELRDAIYNYDNMPLTADNSLRVIKHKLNKKLLLHGLTIKTHGTNGMRDCRYTLNAL